MISDWLNASGLAAAKPLLTALMLPPVPFIALALLGAWLALRRRGTGVAMVLFACLGLWLGACGGTADWLQARLLHPPRALSPVQRQALKARAEDGEAIAIVVLGGGVEREADEYGQSVLASPSLARLRYGVWLGRVTDVPVGMSGGLGWGADSASPEPEAVVGARIAAQDYGRPLRWQETRSRDTHENALNTIALLGPQGIRTLVLVTSAWHMPRALREFQAAAAASAPGMAIIAAPTDFSRWPDRPVLAWIPSGTGALHVREDVREILGAALAP